MIYKYFLLCYFSLSCWFFEAQIFSLLTFDSSVACAIGTYSKVVKNSFCFPTVLWLLHLGLSSHFELFLCII